MQSKHLEVAKILEFRFRLFFVDLGRVNIRTKMFKRPSLAMRNMSWCACYELIGVCHRHRLSVALPRCHNNHKLLSHERYYEDTILRLSKHKVKIK
jgi:hypothetical protein